ncbi:thermonuclease family protein [Pseudothermotoga sp.]
MKKLLLVIFALTVGLLVYAENYTVNVTKLIEATVVRVIDGDTIEVIWTTDVVKVRLIGVNCPEESQYYYYEATQFTAEMVANKTVWLELDIGMYDKYNRLLAYVWLSKPASVVTQEFIEQNMLNAMLLLNGYAQVMTVAPNVKYSNLFALLQRTARLAQRGLWNTSSSSTDSSSAVIVYITDTGNKYHRDGCRYLSQSKIPITLEEAKKRGYEPCTVCNPPR